MLNICIKSYIINWNGLSIENGKQHGKLFPFWQKEKHKGQGLEGRYICTAAQGRRKWCW